MIPLETAQNRALGLARLLETETVPLIQAVGRWTAQDVTALRTQPARNLSAMDGYAIAFQDMPGPWALAGVSAAGGPLPPPLSAQHAMRIFTGAPLPDGADTVLMQEDMIVDGSGVALQPKATTLHGKHVRPAGEDFTAGQMVVPAGTKITPAVAALLAMAGHGAVDVRRKVRIALLSTGDELQTPGAPLAEGQIPASNGLMLQALLNSPEAIVVDQGIVPDNRDALQHAFQAAAGTADLIISTGGASVGDHDHVKGALEAAGAQIDFWKIAMRPGKPLMAGNLGGSVVLGLPGNPVSAFVTAILFAQPIIAKMGGANHPLPVAEPALLDAPLPAVSRRTDHIRGTLVAGRVMPVGLNDSAALLALSHANALIIRPEGAPAAAVGDAVNVIRIA